MFGSSEREFDTEKTSRKVILYEPSGKTHSFFSRKGLSTSALRVSINRFLSTDHCSVTKFLDIANAEQTLWTFLAKIWECYIFPENQTYLSQKLVAAFLSSRSQNNILVPK